MNARLKNSAASIVAACAAAFSASAAAQALVPYQIEGAEIRASLTGVPGDAARGREVVRGRDAGNCLLCHAVPDNADPFMGNLASPLAGVGARLTAGQLRLRLVDARRIVPDTIMPPYYSVEGLQMVGAAYRGKPILNAQQIEDAVAYLASLKEQSK